MKISRRESLKMLAATAGAMALPKALGDSTASAQTAPPATAPAVERPLPPAPFHIEPPAGFGVADGPFKPTWESLSAYQAPDWYRDAKLGIWAHWGPQCQPEMGDWYAQKMYQADARDNTVYKFHVREYGHPSKFGFKDVINEWQAENWEPEKLIALYKRAGAKFFAAMANHHDNTDMWDSTYQPWNTVAIGPKKDIVGGWEKAARAAGLKFALTCHGDRAWSWYQDAQKSDTTGPLKGVPYDGQMTKEDGKGLWWEGLDPQDLYAQYHRLGRYNWPQSGEPPLDKQYCEKYFNRIIDLINKHNPDLLYFDDTVLPIYPASDVGLRIAAYLYNTNYAKNGKVECLMTGKGLNSIQRKSILLDVERGVTNGGETLPWQTDTCIGSWHYERRVFDQHKYKTSLQVVQMLVDIVSKNGNLMLNIPLRGDGTPDRDEIKVLQGLASWIAPNGEGIYSTRPFTVYGEGPSTVTQARGQFGGARDVRPYTSEDIRFTSKGEIVYAFLMVWPENGKATIKSLAQGSANFPKEIARVELLGGDQLTFNRDATGLVVNLPEKKVGDYAYALKITPA
jgi:alpha-L-fucosidase